MSMSTDLETVWHRDGHYVYLQINRGDLVIVMTTCPGGEDRACKIGRFDCTVQWFLDRFGLDCNVGVCDAKPEIELAWSMQGDPFDPDLCQVWVIPVDDIAFAAWLEGQKAE